MANPNENQHDGEADDVVDLEADAKAGKNPRKAKSYRIRIDKDHYVVHISEMIGKDILGLAGKTPQSHQLSQKLRGGRVEVVPPDKNVDFSKDGIERFQTLALDPTEG